MSPLLNTLGIVALAGLMVTALQNRYELPIEAETDDNADLKLPPNRDMVFVGGHVYSTLGITFDTSSL
jgi:hypothetical protein